VARVAEALLLAPQYSTTASLTSTGPKADNPHTSCDIRIVATSYMRSPWYQLHALASHKAAEMLLPVRTVVHALTPAGCSPYVDMVHFAMAVLLVYNFIDTALRGLWPRSTSKDTDGL
jgi:hypothetical protein